MSGSRKWRHMLFTTSPLSDSRWAGSSCGSHLEKLKESGRIFPYSLEPRHCQTDAKLALNIFCPIAMWSNPLSLLCLPFILDLHCMLSQMCNSPPPSSSHSFVNNTSHWDNRQGIVLQSKVSPITALKLPDGWLWRKSKYDKSTPISYHQQTITTTRAHWYLLMIK